MTPRKLTGWRRVAHAIWSAPLDPQIHGSLEIDATPILDIVRRQRAEGRRTTPTHVVGRAVARALHEMPDLNVRIFGGKVFPRRSVDIFFIAAVEGGSDLSGVKVERADEKSLSDIAEEVSGRVSSMKGRRDTEFVRTKQIMDALPLPLLRAALRLSAVITGDLDLPFKAVGLDASPFGSAIVSSVGMMGIPTGYAPLAWLFRVPVIVLAGEIADKPVAINGRVEVRPVLPLTATIDHRYADGWHISQFIKPVRAYLADPAAFEPARGPDQERVDEAV